jgi:protein O-GlcNAc transferase
MAHIPRTRHQSASELASVRMKGALAALDWPLLTRLCRQTLRKMPNDLMGHRLLGFSLTKQRQLDDALKAFRRAIAIWPDDGELIANFGNLLIEQAMNAEALPLLERLCILRPDKAVCWNEFAHCCYALGLHEKGLEAAEKAAELAADVGSQVTALTQKAIHRRELGQIKEAVRDCETAIALYPNFCGSHTNRMLFMLADPDANAKQLARAAEEYAEIFEQPLRVSWPDFFLEMWQCVAPLENWICVARLSRSSCNVFCRRLTCTTGPAAV